MSIEQQVLCAGAQRYVSDVQGNFRSLIEENEIDWDGLVSLVWEEGVAAVLLHQLRSSGARKSVPPETMSQLENLSRGLLTHNLQQVNELTGLVRLFEGHSIPVIPFKGPALAHKVYGDVGIRTSSDLDLFVGRQDVRRAKKILLAHGYKPIQKLSGQAESDFIRDRLAYEFLHEETQSKVEIHWALLPAHNASTIPPELVWNHHTWISLGGVRMRSMHTTLLLPYLCAHASKHCWTRLKWLLDIALLIKACSHEQIRESCALAEELGCERMLHVGFILSERLMGISVPKPARRNVAADEGAHDLADDVVARWLFESEAEEDDLVEAFWFHLKERERWRDRLPFLRHNIWLFFHPTEKDYRLVQLPSSMQFVYFLLRPFRIMKDRINGSSLTT